MGPNKVHVSPWPRRDTEQASAESATELSNAQRDLTALKEAGFKLDWLNSKLKEVSLEWKKAAHS